MDNLIHGFQIISKTNIEEMQAEGIFARHCITGLEVYHLHTDDTENLYQHLAPGVYRFEAKILLNDFCKVLGLPDTTFDTIRGEAETLAGLVLEKLERFPLRGEVIVIGKLRLTVEAVSNRRIEQIRVEEA